MEQLIVLGTGNAMVTKCYNTCFAIQNNSGYVLVDAGGGNGILGRLQAADIDASQIHHLIVTHEHCDHILGVVWVIRKIASMITAKTYDGNLHIYCHKKLRKTIKTLSMLTLQAKFTNLFDDRIKFHKVKDNKTVKMLDWPITFFDIHSTKAQQFGFTMLLQSGKKLTCLGDEPYNELCQPYVESSDWLLSEAFCLYEQRDTFKPYEKHHSTVKDACELAEKMHIPHLVLWHTEDKNYEMRQNLYTAEGKEYYAGDLQVPYDLDIITL